MLLLPLASASALVVGCGLLQINGKPIGKSSSAAAPTETSADTATDDATPAGERSSDDAIRVARNAGNEANAELFEAVKRDEIPPALLQQMVKTEELLLADGGPDAARFFTGRVRTYRFVQAMLALHGGDDEPLQKLYSAELVDHGTTGGKKRATVKIQAKKDHCYVMALKWQAPSGEESVEDAAWSTGKPGVAQRFQWRYTHPRVLDAQGFCATADSSATFDAKVSVAGSKPRLDYAVLSWTRDAMPAEISRYIEVHSNDVCSPEVYKSLWLNPIPGSIVYHGSDPVLVHHRMQQQDNGRLDGLSVDFANDENETFKLDELQDAPSGKARVTKPFREPSCAFPPYAESKLSRALAKCHLKLDDKYNRLTESATHTKMNSSSAQARLVAEAKLQRWSEAEDKERATKCDPIERKIMPQVERAFGEIVDAFDAGSLPPTGQRMQSLRGPG